MKPHTVLGSIVPITLWLAPIRCEALEGAPPALQVQVEDSAGIRIIENPRPPEGSRLGWRIGSEPTVSIGEVDGEEPYLLHVAWDATRLGDGRIVVTNTSTQELRVFDARGAYLETWGGAGEGPGEFHRTLAGGAMARRLDRRVDRTPARHLRLRLGRKFRAHLQHGTRWRSPVALLLFLSRSPGTVPCSRFWRCRTRTPSLRN